MFRRGRRTQHARRVRSPELSEIGGCGLFLGEQLVEVHLLNFITRIIAMIVCCEYCGMHSQRGRR